jgi:hypothetical protein
MMKIFLSLSKNIIFKINIIKRKKKKNAEKSYYKLIPIDHSLSLPDCIEIQEYEMCWMSWNQAQKPITKECLDYIEKIDILDDIRKLGELIKIRDICLKNFRIANIVLKKCAKNGLTLYDIGRILFRPGYEEVPSKIELIVEKANTICKMLAVSNINEKLLNNKIEFLELIKKSHSILPNHARHRNMSFNDMRNSPSHNFIKGLLNESNNIQIVDLSNGEEIAKNNEIINKNEESKYEENVAITTKTNSSNFVKVNTINEVEKKTFEDKSSNSIKRTQSEPKINKVIF